MLERTVNFAKRGTDFFLRNRDMAIYRGVQDLVSSGGLNTALSGEANGKFGTKDFKISGRRVMLFSNENGSLVSQSFGVRTQDGAYRVNVSGDPKNPQIVVDTVDRRNSNWLDLPRGERRGVRKALGLR